MVDVVRRNPCGRDNVHRTALCLHRHGGSAVLLQTIRPMSRSALMSGTGCVQSEWGRRAPVRVPGVEYVRAFGDVLWRRADHSRQHLRLFVLPPQGTSLLSDPAPCLSMSSLSVVPSSASYQPLTRAFSCSARIKSSTSRHLRRPSAP
jgi:hypothetical protein